MLDAITCFSSSWRGFAAQKVRERMQYRHAAPVLHPLPHGSEHRRHKHAGAMRIRHILKVGPFFDQQRSVS